MQSSEKNESNGRRKFLNRHRAGGRLSSLPLRLLRQAVSKACRTQNAVSEVNREEEREKRRDERTEQRLEHNVEAANMALEIVCTDADSDAGHFIQLVEPEAQRHEKQNVDCVQRAEESQREARTEKRLGAQRTRDCERSLDAETYECIAGNAVRRYPHRIE